MSDSNTCDDCGLRCDRCDDRLCPEFGPEPATTCAAHVECVDCAADNTCRDCADARRRVA